MQACLRRPGTCPVGGRTGPFDGSDGFVALDPLRTIDRDRVMRRAGRLEPMKQHEVLDALGRMFAA